MEESIKFKIEEYSCKIKSLEQRIRQTLASSNLELHIADGKDQPVRIVFAGQYSAGKSSILKMLTGREDIAIGGGITTQQTHEYDWNGLVVVDTPGIHTELRPDHDEIAYSEIAAADILVYVITSGLFGDHMGKHFRKIAIDRDKAKEMILVVNKMQDTAKGNCLEQQQILKEGNGFKNVINPYTAEDLNTCFMDVKSYLKYKDSKVSPELLDLLYKRSGYEEFIETLNRFVRDRGIASKLTTRLYMLSSELDRIIHDLEPKSVDTDIDALEENLMQQYSILTEKKASIQQEVNNIYTNAASEIKQLGLEAANLLEEGCSKKAVESALEKKIYEVEIISEQCEKNVEEALMTGFNGLAARFNEIESSDFTKALTARLAGKINQLPENVKNVLKKIGSGAENVGGQIVHLAYKPGAQGGLKLTNFSGSTVNELVLKVGHAFGVKFKPWQAVKIARGVAVAGQVLNFLGIGLSVFMQIGSDISEAKLLDELKTNRQNVRSQFNEAAGNLIENGNNVIKQNIILPLDESINSINSSIQEIRKTKENRSNTCLILELLRNECQTLIQEIHNL